DHGSPSADAGKNSPETADGFAAYTKVRSAAAGHIEPAPGDRLPLDDVEATVVSSAGATLRRALPGSGEKNPVCQDRATVARDPYENPRSTGVVIRYGKFRFLDVGDLSGEPLFNLACPKNMIGPVDAYLVAHHGGPDVADPATFAAFRPRVAVMNNGTHKGGAPETFKTLHAVSGLEDVWQLHLAEAAADQNFAADRVANLDESTAHWIKLSASRDGSFRVLNGRTGQGKTYPAR